MKVLVVGLGNIGGALARTIIRSGKHEVAVWNRSVQKGHELFTPTEAESEKLVWNVVESLPDALPKAELLVISLASYDMAYPLFDLQRDHPDQVNGLAAQLEGKVILQLTYVW